MKKLPLMLLLLAGFASADMIDGNGADRGGGDPYEQEIRTIGRDVVAKLRSLQEASKQHGMSAMETSLLAIDIDELERRIDTVTIVSTDEPVFVVINGEEKQRALSNSSATQDILCNRPMWRAMKGDWISKHAIVVHEYFGTMGLDRDYKLSTSYRRRLEFEADTTLFKGALSDQVKEFGKALSARFNEQFEAAFARFETIMTTNEYERCTNLRVVMSEAERLAECFGVTAMLVRAEKLSPVPADANHEAYDEAHMRNIRALEQIKRYYNCDSNLRIPGVDPSLRITCPKIDSVISAYRLPQKVYDPSEESRLQKKYLDFVDSIEIPGRQDLALDIHDRLADEYRYAKMEIRSKFDSYKKGANLNCPDDMGGAIKCAITYVLNSFVTELQPRMLEMHKHLGESVRDSLNTVNEYSE